MRPILVGLCVFSIGCSGQAAMSPTSPTAAGSSLSATSLTSQELPFSGSLTATETGVLQFPLLFETGTAQGTATYLGRYTAAFDPTVNVLDGTATGSYTFTAANGDQLFSTFVGLGVPAGGTLASITETLTITGGTGRFANAAGTLVVKRLLDQATNESSGSIAGSIVMKP